LIKKYIFLLKNLFLLLTNPNLGDTIILYNYLYRILKGGNYCMKKFYTSPELEVTELLAEDILTASTDLSDEVEMDGSDLFN